MTKVLQENTYAGVSVLMKSQVPCIFIKRGSHTGVFLGILQTFLEHLYCRISVEGYFEDNHFFVKTEKLFLIQARKKANKSFHKNGFE